MRPDEYLQQNQNQTLEQWKEWLRIPSISAQAEHRGDVHRAAEWAAKFFLDAGIPAEVIPRPGHPVVYAEAKEGQNLPTVLVYGHYDVQPPDPLDGWTSPPFEPSVRDGRLYARGTTDDKGQVFIHMKAVEAFRRSGQRLPVNVKFLIEGEEETAGSHLDEYVQANPDKLAADVVVVSDGLQFGPGMPALTFGLRGIAAMEIRISGPSHDLHSGEFGGIIDNPIHVLARLIATLHDDTGRVAVPGFYEHARPLTDAEKAHLARLPVDPQSYLRSSGADRLWGEPGYSILERMWARPTMEVNGITGGYQGEGGKTIIPAWASAKITMRLVPDMDPGKILPLVERHLRSACPDTVHLEVVRGGGATPVRLTTESPELAAAARAIRTGFGVDPFFILEGGSIPVVETFKRVLGADTLLLGIGQPDDNAHAPDEHLSVRDFHRGCRTAVALLEELAKG